jgi:hypothetical protein
VRLLFDEDLSFRLVRELADVYPGSTHAREISYPYSPKCLELDFIHSGCIAKRFG